MHRLRPRRQRRPGIGKTVDPLPPIPALGAENSRSDRVPREIQQVCRVFGGLKHGAEDCEEQARRADNAERFGDAQRFQDLSEGEGQRPEPPWAQKIKKKQTTKNSKRKRKSPTTLK